MEILTKEKLNQISRAVVSAADPLIVILMGSQSAGKARPDSDIDLLVIGERSKNGPWSRRRMVGNIRRRLPKTDRPVDVLYFTPEEVARWGKATNHVINHALTEGTVIYERP